jgi:tryptophan-rich sensory protein
MKKFLVIAIAVLVSFSAGFIGSLFTVPAIPGWYAGLAKPAFNPPNWIFGPVWSLLYLLMGLAAGLVILKSPSTKAAKWGLALFAVQLVLNALWSYLFFGLHAIPLALADIILLFFFILATLIAFHRTSPPAAYLLLPYLLWVGFAAVLTHSIWTLNR